MGKFVKVLAAVLVVAGVVWGQSGTTGPLTWRIEDGTLTISGEGAMPNYDWHNYTTTAPWATHRRLFSAVIIEDGVTTIGDRAFTPLVVSPFIPVVNIILTSQGSATVGVPFTLTAIVSPSTPSGGNVVTWSGIGVSGNTLTATEQGPAQVTATIPNGRAPGQDYDTTFTITVNAPAQGFDPNAANVVLLDNFQVRSLTPDNPESFDFTNQNALMLRTIGNQAGTWYAHANSQNDVPFGGSSALGAVKAFSESGDEINILSGVNNSSTEESMLKVLGNGRMIVALDASEAANTGDGWYYATLETPFIRSGTNAIPVNLSGLQAVRLRTQLKGVLDVVITSPLNAIGTHSQWGWTIGTPNHDGTNDWETIEVTLNVSDMIQTNGPTAAGRAASLASADAFSFQLNTYEGTRVDLDIDHIYLIFHDEASIPASFGERLQPHDATIPNSVTSVENSAFASSTGLTSVTIGNSVTTIGDWAFWGCTGLTEIVNYANTPQVINPNVFADVQTNNIRLLVPNRAVNAYRTAEVWRNFNIAGISNCNYNWLYKADASWYFMAETEFTINTPEQLAGLALIVNEGVGDFSGKTVRLGNNVSLNNTNDWQNWVTSPSADLICWTPIGTSENPFRGTFDGNGFVVSGIYIDIANDNQGLFGVVEDGRIEKLGVVASCIWGRNNVGGLAGKTNRTAIEYCFSIANVTGNSDIGGLIGNSNSAIVQCYATGNITGESNVGGLVGNRAGGTIASSFFNSETLGGGDNGIARTAAQMRTQSNYLGWDFREEIGVWKINSEINNGFPYIIGYAPSSIRNRQLTDNRFGILLENAVVSDFAKISVITPEPATINLRIFDNLGNVVFTETAVRANNHSPIIWNLQNQSGRLVANGTYLVVVEATGISGRRFTYSSRIGVQR